MSQTDFNLYNKKSAVGEVVPHAGNVFRSVFVPNSDTSDYQVGDLMREGGTGVWNVTAVSGLRGILIRVDTVINDDTVLSGRRLTVICKGKVWVKTPSGTTTYAVGNYVVIDRTIPANRGLSTTTGYPGYPPVIRVEEYNSELMLLDLQ